MAAKGDKLTLAKAIEILQTQEKTSPSFHSPDFWDAVKLTIEASKRLRLMRTYPIPMSQPRLPGEDTH